jgi:polyribonucleotide nucleotidyltransferase
VLAHDQENDPDIVAMVGASAALTISGIPFLGPIGGARVGFKDGQYILNPTYQQLPESELDLVIAGTQDAVMMVESEAKELSEEEMLGAVMFGQQQFQPVIDMIISMAEECAKEPWDLEVEDHSALYGQIKSALEAELRTAYAEPSKAARHELVEAVKAKAAEQFAGEDGDELQLVMGQFKKLEKEIVRGAILDTGQRIDGRDTETVRPIVAEVGFLPRVHGSALFTRGETQAMVVATLGTGQDEQIIDALEGDYRQHFMLHYNFPPYSVGEVGFLRSPGRREIGHGKLAWRAVRPLLPERESFPYTIRLVSEITESNGSSSMATVCGSSLALMDAGVPLERPDAGIAMGLNKEHDRFAVHTDNHRDEDHHGDMYF